MTLKTLARQLREQPNIPLNEQTFQKAGLQTVDDFDVLIRGALMLGEGGNLLVKAPNIPEPTDNTLEFQGTASFLNLKAQNLTITLKLLDNGEVQCTLLAPLEDNWQFSHSFAYLDGYPFSALAASERHFIFSSHHQPEYSWQKQAISLKAGLNFASYLKLDSLSSILALLADILDRDGRYPFYGAIDPSRVNHTSQNFSEIVLFPEMSLSAPLSEKPFPIGELHLDVSSPRLKLEISPAERGQQDIWLALEVNLNVDDTIALDFRTAILHDSNLLMFAIVPDPNKPITVDNIITLAGGEDFRKRIPDVLKDTFSSVGLKGFASSIYIATPPKVSSLNFAIGSTRAWQLFDDFKIDELSLRFGILDPLSSNKIVTAYFKAEFYFFPKIFKGKFEIEIISETDDLQISGSYQGIVSLNDLVKEISGGQVTIPSEFISIQFSDFGLAIDRAEKSYYLHGTSDFAFSLPLVEHKIEMSLSVEINKSNSESRYFLTGGLGMGRAYFSGQVDLSSQQKTLAANWRVLGEQYLELKDIAQTLNFNLPEVPKDLDLALKEASLKYDFGEKQLILSAESANYGKAVFAALKIQGQRKYIFGLSLGKSIDLSKLPLVDRVLPKEQTISIENIRAIVASKNIDPSLANTVNPLLPVDYPKIPQQGTASPVCLSIEMKLGQEVIPLSLGAGNPSNNGGESTTDNTILAEPQGASSSLYPTAAPVKADSATWFKIQKSFGPVHFERVGVEYKGQILWFLLDAVLSAGDLTVGLEGLSVGSPLADFQPQFNLHGLSIDYQNPTVEMGGAFLRKTVTKNDITYDEYDGTLIAKAKIGKAQKALTLSAVGSYAYLDGHPSMFVYTVLDYPLGGPPFFFVTGFVGAFGYNRTLQIPSIDEVKDFPLVTEAIHNTGNGNNLAAELEKISPYIPPAVGEYFLAIGIKFTSFKLIDSFVLLTASFGNRLEFNILGLSTAILPPAEAGKAITPLAKIQMALKVSFIPDEGTLKVEAKLTDDSYLFSKDCHLTGGFAFYSWFSGEHSGDFVATIGGYHPQFNIPSHYPQKVPRLGLNWRIDRHTTIKGAAYFALCPHALMAGIHLDATYNSSALKASFKLGADFLIAWKPYHYDARVWINISASCTFHRFGTHHINANVGANLHLWGPEFSGTATIHIWIFSITIHFGAGSSQKPQAISWNTFKTSFLPKDTQVCTLAVKDGLVRKLGDDPSNLGVINPKHFALVTNSVIPAKEAYNGDKTLDSSKANTKFGIGSMDVKADDLSSKHKIEITRNGVPVEESEFDYIPIQKKVPVGLWGESLTPNLNGPKFIDNALSGFEIRPKNRSKPSQTHAVNRSNLQSGSHNAPVKYHWENQTPFTPSTDNDDQRRIRIRNTVVQNSQRNSLLQNMGFDPSQDVDLNQQVATDFLVAPQVKA